MFSISKFIDKFYNRNVGKVNYVELSDIIENIDDLNLAVMNIKSEVHGPLEMRRPDEIIIKCGNHTITAMCHLRMELKQ